MPAFGLSEPAAYVVITASTAILWSLLTLAIRIFLRIRINGPFSWDDVACVAATTFGVLYSSLTLAQVRLGLGKHSDDSSVRSTQTARVIAWVNAGFLTLGLTFSTLSMCFLLVRICNVQRKVCLAYSIAAAAGTYGLVAIFLTAFQCRLPTPWDITHRQRCIDLWALYASQTAIMTALEFANVVMAVVTVWGLQMPLWPKVQVIVLFALRLLIIAPSITRLRYLHAALFATDWSYARVPLQIVNQIYLHLSIILATLPCAKPFLTVFESGALHIPFEHDSRTLPMARAAHVDGKSSSTMVTLVPQRTWHRRQTVKWRVNLRPDSSKTVTSVRYDPQDAAIAARRRSIGSSNSSRNAITRTDEVTVAYDDAHSVLRKRHGQGDSKFERLSGL